MSRSRKRKRESEGRLRPTIDSLRVFVELGDRVKAAQGEGTSYASLSELAESLSASYSKSNVFRALSELRKVYGRQLVNRSTVTLTTEGESVYGWARSLLELHARGSRWPIGNRTDIRIGASSWIINFLIPEIVRAFLAGGAERNESTPDVDLIFGEFDVEEILVALRKGTVQAGLAAVFSVESYPGLSVQAVRKGLTTVMIASSDHERWGKRARKTTDEVTLRELARETVCVIEADLYRVLADLPPPARGQPRILVENYATVAALVRAGAAVGLLPQLHAGDEPDHPAYQGLEVYRVREKLVPRTLALLRRAGEDLPAVVEEFLAVVLKTLGASRPAAEAPHSRK